MGEPVNKFTSQIMKIVVVGQKRLLQEEDNGDVPSTGLTFIEAINKKMNLYENIKNNVEVPYKKLDFID